MTLYRFLIYIFLLFILITTVLTSNTLSQTSEEKHTIFIEQVSDATINSLYPDTNFGNLNNNLSVQYLSSRQIQRCLLRFNLATALPTEAIITSALLHIYEDQHEGPNSLILTARCITQEWVESQVTWNNQPLTGSPLVTMIAQNNPGLKTFNITSIVQAWHQVPHYGLEILGPEGETTYRLSFHNRQHTTMAPQLEITYSIENDTQPPEGWCCCNGEIIPSTEEECSECSGTFYESYEEAEQDCIAGSPENRYDLSLTNIWFEENTIYYEIINNGDLILNNDIIISLFINNELITNDHLNTPLEPQQTWHHSFNYTGHCHPEQQHIRIWADSTNQLIEYNESNNQKEAQWLCDEPLLELLSGPTAVEITPTSAVITWETTTASDSILLYGTINQRYTHNNINTTPTTHHILQVNELQPATIYCYKIHSTSTQGQTIESTQKIFKTQSLPDTSAPTIILNNPGTLKDTQYITATANDDQHINRVEFYLDDILLSTDYSPPYQFLFNSRNYPNGIHDLKGKVYDNSNNQGHDDLKTDIANLQDKTTPLVQITYPTSGQTVTGSLAVHVTASDDVALLYGKFMVDGNWSGNWYPSTEGIKKENFTFPWHTLQYSNGKHRIAFEIYDTDFNTGIGYQDVYVNNAPPQKPPDLQIINRDIKQTGNYFTITLTVKNYGGTAAQKIRILDTHQLFQPIAKNSSEADYQPEFKPELTTWETTITSKVSISPGKQQQYSYYLVPVLIPPVSLQPIQGGTTISAVPPKNLLPIIGGTKYINCTDIWYEPPDASETYYKRIPLSSIEAISYQSALNTSDYLIITSPRNLLKFNPKNDVNQLLSSMAELARLKNGALGFLDPAAQFSRTFEKYDELEAHNIIGGPSAEIIIADKTKDCISIYSVEDRTLYFTSANGNAPFHTNWWAETEFKCGFGKDGFNDGDRIAVGQVGTLINTSIVMGDSSSGAIITYDGQGYPKKEFLTSFDSFDGLAVGDVNGDGKGEIIIAHTANNTILIHQPDGTLLGTFSAPYASENGLIVGDVIGDNKEEIIIADDKNDKIFLYSNSGKLISWFYYRYDNGDGFAVGNMISTWPQDKEEIIIGDPRGKDITILRGDGWELDWFERDFTAYDGLAVGDFTGSGICDVIIGDQNQNFIDIHGLDQTTGNKYILHNLINKYGSWSNALSKNWTSEGYLLIVGETEIIPAWAGKSFGSVTTTKGKVALQADVTDYPYASTTGEEIVPELCIGRIIGNRAKDLIIPIETSINVEKNTNGYGYNHNNYFAVSGFPRGLSGGADNIDFKNELSKIALIMHANNIYGVVMFTPDYEIKDSSGIRDQHASADAIVKTFFANTPSKNIILLSGHGNSNSWDALGADDVLLQNSPFGTTNPAIYAASCSTGSYQNGLSFAESMLMEGAGVYYGATKWGLGTHSWIHQKFFQMWKTGSSIGQIAREIKRSIADKHYGSTSYPDIKARYYSSIYHIFGDPKYGQINSTINTIGSAIKSLFQTDDETTESNTVATTSINIQIPLYETKISDDQRYSSIPGGDLLMVENHPMVPYYRITYNFPKNCQIQDIRLISSADLATESNVILPTITEAIGADESELQSSEQSGETVEWWPTEQYSWSTYENSNNSTVALTIYPYQYSSEHNEARFTSSFNFDIDYRISSIEINNVQLTKPLYELGEPLIIDIVINNSNTEGQDVILSASIIAENSDQIIGGIPFTLLTDVKQTATFSTIINTTDLHIGYYEILVEARDHTGAVLDHNYAYFKLGSTKGVLNNITIDQNKYHSENHIDISFLFENIGSTNITGTATFLIKNPTTNAEYHIFKEFDNITPGDSQKISGSWDTTKINDGPYQLTVTVAYDGTSTTFKSLEFSIGDSQAYNEFEIILTVALIAIMSSIFIVFYFIRWRKK